MAMVFPGSATVNISGQVTSTPTIRNATTATGQAAGVTSTTIYTVPANKKARILNVHAIQAASGAATEIHLNDVAALRVYAVAATANCGNAINWDYSAAPQLAAGQTIKLVSTNAATTIYGGLLG